MCSHMNIIETIMAPWEYLWAVSSSHRCGLIKLVFQNPIRRDQANNVNKRLSSNRFALLRSIASSWGCRQKRAVYPRGPSTRELFQVVKLDHNHTVYEDIFCPSLTIKFTFKKGLSSCSKPLHQHPIVLSGWFPMLAGYFSLHLHHNCNPTLREWMDQVSKTVISINNDYRITILDVNYFDCTILHNPSVKWSHWSSQKAGH